MKREVALLVLLFSSLILSAQDTVTRLGISGGMTSEKFTSSGDRKTGWHAGATCQINFPLYLSLQPSVIFERCGAYADLDGSGPSNLKMNNLKIPVIVQWGPDLGFFRPYIQGGPFADILLGAGSDSIQNPGTFLKRAELGVGLGLGVEIWKFQISARYNWALKSWLNVLSTNLQAGRGRGVELSLTFFFN